MDVAGARRRNQQKAVVFDRPPSKWSAYLRSLLWPRARVSSNQPAPAISMAWRGLRIDEGGSYLETTGGTPSEYLPIEYPLPVRGSGSAIDEYPCQEYIGSMRVKTSVTLSPETLRAIDEIAGELLNRSRVIEQAVLEFIERRRRADRDARDLEILNRSADVLNEEVEDVLAYQIEL